MATTFSSAGGRAVLCFPRDGTWFQGYFVCASSRAQLGLMGEEVPVDDCVACPDGGYQEYRLTVMHFALDKEVELVVRKTGGDLCQLDSDALQFQPSMLLTDGKAVEAIETYFPGIADRVDHDASLLQECTVCFGDMEVTRLAFSVVN
ncbi:hypothetical protein PHYPSEUDO_012731 [Phytophthora pseudosyringae]|uniref:Uncharacterized protein n=1 Tax=Phytophthora pseudosyringae TaxID=221518 RepID=A0A8T1W883_9STRA|nr:hypothetical protein PHYPSEUDO_012731 [Phytophthora pseudosyringae]